MGKLKIFCMKKAVKAVCVCLSVAVTAGLCYENVNEPTYKKEEYINAWSEDTATAEELKLYAQSAVLMDAKTGEVLYAKNADEVMPMASTTKIMTCILALENGNPDDMVTASAYAAGMPKVKLYLREGEQYRLEDLMYSLMLESHNDSAVAIAEHIGSNVENFAEMMNAKAAQLGCKSTYFITPNGLDSTNDENGLFHSTTAAELARIMAYCVNESGKKEEFLKITQTKNYSFTNSAGRSYSCVNHNALLNMMDCVISGKTGFTGKAGYCYVGAARQDDRLFTVALLACGWPNNKTYKWSDCKTLFDYGFDTYHYQEIFENLTFEPVYVSGGIPKEDDPYHKAYVTLKPEIKPGPLKVLMKDSDVIEIEKIVPDMLNAPVYMGTRVGSVRYCLNGHIIREEPVIAADNVIRQSKKWFCEYIFRKYLL